MAWDMETYGPRALSPQTRLKPVRTRFFWSSRLANDPASTWIRRIVLETYSALQEEADRMVERNLLTAMT